MLLVVEYLSYTRQNQNRQQDLAVMCCSTCCYTQGEQGSSSRVIAHVLQWSDSVTDFQILSS